MEAVPQLKLSNKLHLDDYDFLTRTDGPSARQSNSGLEEACIR